ncbi:hypothetical protein Gpo141_00001973 [Globisporangium polare]
MDPERLRAQHYRFHRRITETSYSLVDEYECVAPGVVALRQVAVKRIPFKQPRDRDVRVVLDKPHQDQLVAELLLARRAADGDGEEDMNQHPNVVQVRDVLVEQDEMFVVMEYCADGDLLQHLHMMPDSVLDEATALGFFRQILRGLVFLHAQCGLAHRDLSLENILLHNGVCKITDFGLSTTIRAGQLCEDFVGKEFYMAPEIVACRPYDPVKADVWSLGIVLFVMLTGSPLFALATNSDDGYRALTVGGIDAILVSWGLRNSVSTDVVVLLSEMLQVDPEKRTTVDAILALPMLM